MVVKPPLVHTIAFHVVRDSATPPHFSKRSSGNILQLFGAMNNVYIPQANVSFLWNGVVNVITVPIDLGDKVETPTSPKSQEWNEIVNRGDPAAPLRVFYVHDFDFTDSAKEELGGAESIPGRDTMMGDDTPLNRETTVLAHEVAIFTSLGAGLTKAT